ncbi:MAG: Xaa-Pro peptidase family protein [Acidobacteriota bacterium]
MHTAPPDAFRDRLTRLRGLCADAGVDGLLVTSIHNLAYLTGLHASAGALIVLPGEARLITDGRYAEAAEARRLALPDLVIRQVGRSSYDETLSAELRDLEGLRIGVEAEHLSIRRFRFIQAAISGLAPLKLELVETQGLVEGLRMVKDAWEVETLRASGARLMDVAKSIWPNVLAGATERDLAGLIEAGLRRAGFDKPAFDTIVASGPHSAQPHYRAGDRRLEDGDLVVVDFGGMRHGYAVDFTRTVVVGGRPTPRQRFVLEAVAAAAEAAFQAVRPGVPPESVDGAARAVLESAGLGEAFSHGTGHGLGLEVHESPRIARALASHPQPPLAEGMVFTVEPGAYVAGWGGVRIENDVLVTASGGELLTEAPSLGFE